MSDLLTETDPESIPPRPRSRGRPAPEAVPTDADPADHAELVALFRAWGAACDGWAAVEDGSAGGERLYAEMARLSRECRRRLAADLPAGVRLVVDPGLEVWHGGGEGAFNRRRIAPGPGPAIEPEPEPGPEPSVGPPAPRLLPRTHRHWDDYSDGRGECERHGLTLVLRPDGAEWAVEIREGDAEVANYTGFVGRPEASVAAALYADGYREGKARGGGS